MKLELDLDQEDRKLFLQEADEQLQLLDEDLVRLEKESDNTELLQEIFRAAHTLKGSSATIGHQKMTKLTHAMETLLDKLRKGELVVTSAIVNALLESLDTLRLLKDEVETLEDGCLDLEPVIRNLAEQHSDAAQELAGLPEAGAGPVPPLSFGEYEAAAAQERGKQIYEINITLDKKNEFNAVRSWQAISGLSEIGRVTSSTPSMAEIEQEKVGDSLLVLVSSPAGIEQIEEALRQVSDLVSFTVVPWKAPEAIVNERKGQVGPEPKVEGKRWERAIDLGPEARGKPPSEQLKIASHKITQLAKTVRIDIERLDTLMNLVGELVIDQARLERIGNSLEQVHKDDGLVASLTETSRHVRRISDQLRQEVMKARLLPIETVFNKLPRVVRDLAAKSGKKVDFIVEGKETDLDRSVIEEIGDPLIHLLRNALDHGIETPEERKAAGKPDTGVICLSARHEEGNIAITIEDDGRGIDGKKVRDSMVAKKLLSEEEAKKLSDAESVRLIFGSGVSTAKEVTDVSGRGVGMDIVKTNIERIGGTVEVETKLGQGTKFIVKLPLTLAIIEALLVSANDTTYAIPASAIAETFRIKPVVIKSIGGREVVPYRDRVLPLLRLRKVFGNGQSSDSGREYDYVVVARFGQELIGLVLDSLLGQQQIVMKNLGSFVGDSEGIAGATILGDGRVGLIIDVPGLIRSTMAA